jgi:hypothetical protein
MAIVVRVALLVLLTAMLVGVVVGVFTGGTGPFEKAVFVALGCLVVLAATRVRRIGSHPAR